MLTLAADHLAILADGEQGLPGQGADDVRVSQLGQQLQRAGVDLAVHLPLAAGATPPCNAPHHPVRQQPWPPVFRRVSAKRLPPSCWQSLTS